MQIVARILYRKTRRTRISQIITNPSQSGRGNARKNSTGGNRENRDGKKILGKNIIPSAKRKFEPINLRKAIDTLDLNPKVETKLAKALVGTRSAIEKNLDALAKELKLKTNGKQMLAALEKAQKLRKLVAALVALLFVTLVIVVTNFIHAKSYPATNSCANNLRQIEGTQQQWQLENHKSTDDPPPTLQELAPYMGKIPICPSGGKYIPGRIGEDPKFSVGGRHSITG